MARHYLGYVITHRSSGRPDELAYLTDEDYARIEDLYSVKKEETPSEN
jgi:hypothetical protein